MNKSKITHTAVHTNGGDDSEALVMIMMMVMMMVDTVVAAVAQATSPLDTEVDSDAELALQIEEILADPAGTENRGCSSSGVRVDPVFS